MSRLSTANSGEPSFIRSRSVAARSGGRAGRSIAFQTLPTPASRFLRQGIRIARFQKRWESIKQDLPPQLSRRHIGMISIGGVIGTGLFLGSAAALKNGGPLGALLGYAIIGTVVYCLCVSVGEMIAFLPNVGGVVGLADLFVDPALGFSMGWAAWYNWSVTLPAEISAAAIVIRFWDTEGHVPTAVLSGLLLFLAIAVNCFPSRIYGEFEFWFSTMKVVMIIFLLLACLIIDFGAGHEGFIGFRNWETPFSADYLGITGSKGRFLGFLAVLMQASFSFSGSEVPGIAAGEVINATRNVPRALRRVWIRIMIFYIGGIFVAGLLVPSNDSRLGSQAKDASSSPFVIAFDRARISVLPHVVNAAVLLSAWSAAASDVSWPLIRYPYLPRQPVGGDRTSDDSESDSDDDRSPRIYITRHMDDVSDQDDAEITLPPSQDSLLFGSPANSGSSLFKSVASTVADKDQHVNVSIIEASPDSSGDAVDHEIIESGDGDSEQQLEVISRERRPLVVIPLAAVFVSASVGFLSFLGSVEGSTPEAAFGWMVAAASVASLQSWAGILFTYIRFYQGTAHAERTYEAEVDYDEHARKVIGQIKQIRRYRHWGQPYLAWYAFIACLTVLLINGWSVFVHNGWRIANIPGRDYSYDPKVRVSDAISMFLSSYVPIPFFLLLTFGYKLIHRTRMVRVEEMTFERDNVPDMDDPATTGRGREGGFVERLIRWMLLG